MSSFGVSSGGEKCRSSSSVSSISCGGAGSRRGGSATTPKEDLPRHLAWHPTSATEKAVYTVLFLHGFSPGGQRSAGGHPGARHRCGPARGGALAGGRRAGEHGHGGGAMICRNGRAARPAVSSPGRPDGNIGVTLIKHCVNSALEPGFISTTLGSRSLLPGCRDRSDDHSPTSSRWNAQVEEIP